MLFLIMIISYEQEVSVKMKILLIDSSSQEISEFLNIANLALESSIDLAHAMHCDVCLNLKSLTHAHL